LQNYIRDDYIGYLKKEIDLDEKRIEKFEEMQEGMTDNCVKE
jgi:hypothetical protein